MFRMNCLRIGRKTKNKISIESDRVVGPEEERRIQDIGLVLVLTILLFLNAVHNADIVIFEIVFQ